MTTEVGSASEVKKGSDQSGGADTPKEKAKEAENEQTPVSEPEDEKGSQSGPAVQSQSSPRRRKREKAPSESRGISRFIPPWLKKQKSYNLVVANDGGDKKEPTPADVESQVLEKENSLPEEESRAKGDAEEMAQRKHLEVKVEVKEQKPSLKSSAETQVCEEPGREGTAHRERVGWPCAICHVCIGIWPQPVVSGIQSLRTQHLSLPCESFKNYPQSKME